MNWVLELTVRGINEKLFIFKLWSEVQRFATIRSSLFFSRMPNIIIFLLENWFDLNAKINHQSATRKKKEFASTLATDRGISGKNVLAEIVFLLDVRVHSSYCAFIRTPLWKKLSTLACRSHSFYGIIGHRHLFNRLCKKNSH